MNTANLQLEGLLLSISFLFETMRRKGLLTKQEIDTALQEAETSMKLEAVKSDLSPANLEAIRFPIRFLRAATSMTSTGKVSFATLTAMAVETKHGR